MTISSTAGLYGYGMRTPYAAAKWAVIGFTKSLAVELGPFGVRANVVAPGAVEGPRMGRVIEAEAVQRGRPGRRRASGSTSRASRSPASSSRRRSPTCARSWPRRQASMVNGQVIAVDGHTETFHIASRADR